jgi:response regulator NasT
MRILVAEDEPIIRLGLKAMLQELGHEVTVAANGQEALAMARRQPFDIAILDIRMPYTDGLQAAATLSRISPMPILFLTAYSEQTLIDEASALPIHGYLVKPVTPEQLKASIAVAEKRFAEQRRQQDEKNALESKLAASRLVERAKAKLMAAGMTEAAAHQEIQQRARNARLPVLAIAQEILETNG